MKLSKKPMKLSIISLINRAIRITRTTAAAIDNILTNSYSESNIYSGAGYKSRY